jgi:RNA polymerase sigma-70 factor (ECF subfamily)
LVVKGWARLSRSGDGDDAWRAWLDRHGPALLLYARQWCPSRADAEDAVQDGFVRFWKSRERARDDAAYLFACVRTAALDLSRAGQRRRRHENDAGVFERRDGGSEELRETVEAALTTLPLEQREVLVLKIWGGLTFAQIGESLAISPNTAASRYRYALERLESLLAKEMWP